MIRLSAAVLLACVAGIAPAATPFEPDLATLQAVPRVELPAAAVEKALEAPAKDQPYRYAVPVDVTLDARQGVWLSRGALASWRLRVHSPGAKSLSLYLPRPRLPAEARLWTYDAAGRLVHGPYEASRLDDGGLWTPPVAGDELVIEVRGPAGIAGALGLGAAKAFHGFRGWTREAAAGSCNIDITCPQAAAWTGDAGAVARISIGGQYLCTGQLVNNVRQDGRRLFLTANHCGIETDGGPAASVVFYFNYTGACGDGDQDPLPAPTFQGSQRLAHDVQSDFTLVLITDPAPLPPGVRFAGWDATGAASGAGVSIHHPAGDEKKIAFHDEPPVRDTIDIGAACAIDAWRVTWNTGGGTTEAGSSGGGLWDGSHRLIGVLTGGLASCANPTGADYFARFERAWTANAAADGQLKAHLDPDGSCVAVVPLLDPATSPGPVAPTADNQRCSGPASLCVRPRGGGGGALDLVALALLALAARRRLQHHQQHAGHRHG